MTPREKYERWKLNSPKHFQEVLDNAADIVAQLVDRGFRHYGMHAVIETVRFHRALKYGPSAAGEFKITNTHEPYLAREMMDRGLAPAGFFDIHELPSERKVAA